MVVEDSSVAIRVEGLGREYGELVALDGVSFALGEGRTLAVLGPNGAGKSTLLRILAGLLRPTAGEVSVLGCGLPREGWKLRGQVGYLGHAPMLYRDLTIVENLEFQAKLHGLVDDSDGRIAELVEAVGLHRRRHELVSNLSAGMLHRADIARMLLVDPPLLLLDEPWSHLDPAARETVAGLLGPMPGRTRVIVSHEPEAAAADADEVLLLAAGGHVAWHGAAEDFAVNAGHELVYAEGAP